MTIDLDCTTDDVYTLSDWLESDQAGEVQRQLEEKIMQMLFSQDPSSDAFQKTIAQFAWLGSRPETRSLLERDIIALNQGYEFEQCGFWKEVWNGSKKVGNFIADHATEILVGAAICATGIGAAYVTGYALSASIGGVVVAGAGSIFISDEKKAPNIPAIPLPDPHACSKQELAALQLGLPSTLPNVQLPASTRELLVTPDGIWANGQYFSTNTLMKHSMVGNDIAHSHWKTFAFYTYFSEQLGQQNTLSSQTHGKTALALGNYPQAVQDFGQAIEANPRDPAPYLDRAAALFGMEQYDAALHDYQQFCHQNQQATPPSIADFTIGFVKGVPKGVYESGKGLLLFFADFIEHPVQTSKQVYDAVATLVNLARKDEWGTIAETLSPEIYQLVIQWDALPSDKRGELAGHAIGKHGADILAPGALSKIASKSAASARELVEVCKTLQIAQETLVLEAASGVGSAVKIAEIIEVGKNTVALGEELGLTAQEMGALKEAGKLEAAVSNASEHLTPSAKQSLTFFDTAEEFLKPYKGFMSESQARELIHKSGVRTFPRPQGIPENYRVQISDKGAGIIYFHPDHTHTSVRVMPGKPHSPLPHQHNPYVVHVRNGKALDKFGNELRNKYIPEAHIPHEEFIYRN